MFSVSQQAAVTKDCCREWQNAAYDRAQPYDL